MTKECKICKDTIDEEDYSISDDDQYRDVCEDCYWGIKSFGDSHDTLMRAATYLMTKGGT